jgi:hypothetical protein
MARSFDSNQPVPLVYSTPWAGSLSTVLLMPG